LLVLLDILLFLSSSWILSNTSLFTQSVWYSPFFSRLMLQIHFIMNGQLRFVKSSLFRHICKFHKGTIRFVMSVYPPSWSQEATWLPLDRFSWNLILLFVKFCQENLTFIKSRQEWQVLHVKK
jgi:hypothetical protein